MSRVCVVLAVVAVAASAQRWEYQHDGPAHIDDEFIGCCAVEPDGSCYFAGEDVDEPDSSNFLVVALSSAGAERWVDNGLPGSAEDICIGNDGLIYTAGSVHAIWSDRRFTVVCQDRWGERRWVYQACGESGWDGLATAICPREGNGVYVGGWVSIPGYGWQFAVAALDSAGTEVWLDTLGAAGTASDRVQDLCVGSDGHIYVCGYLTDTQWPVGAVVSLAASGAVRWAQFDSLFYPLAICSGADGNVYVGGSSGPQLLPDIAARSFAPDGSPRWSYSYDPGGRGALNLDHVKDIVWGSGNLYIGGQGCRDDDYLDAFIFSLEPDGDERWQYWYRGEYG
ncbi:hypothetical protein JXD38_06850, partial [candidate division WOR-3 bacterium]|nr:hypothetical protein [candidate division WOR-3 bacterium]